MKRIAFYLVFILSFCVVSNNASAQSSDSLGVVLISPDYPQCPDTAFLGQQTGNITVSVQNFDTNTFVGILYIKFDASDSTTQLQTDSFLLNNGALVTIPGGNTDVCTLTGSISFDTAHYRLGSNVVIVWPVLSSGTLKYNPYITCVTMFNTLGIDDPDPSSTFSISPNPSGKEIRVSGPLLKTTESVRIYDVSSRLVYNEKLQHNSIPVEFLNPGTYILEIITRNNQRLRKQFLKE